MTTQQAVRCYRAYVDGRWDDPVLVKFGPIHHENRDLNINEIAACAGLTAARLYALA